MRKDFSNCPFCASEQISFEIGKRYFCNSCGREYFHNTAAAVGGILEFNGKILTVVRNNDPKKGLLDLPGGFVDPHENAENALIREVKEELNVEISNIKYFCSAPNIYHYRDVEYSTCDIFFTATLQSDRFDILCSEINEVIWFDPKNLNGQDFAFDSIKTTIKFFQKEAITNLKRTI